MGRRISNPPTTPSPVRCLPCNFKTSTVWNILVETLLFFEKLFKCDGLNSELYFWNFFYFYSRFAVGQFTFIAISFYGLTINKTHCALTFELKYLNYILFSQSFCGWIIYFKCKFIFTGWQLIKLISPRLWNNNI